MTTQGEAAGTARTDVRDLIAAKGHAVVNARAAVTRLEAAFTAATWSGRRHSTCTSAT